MTRKLWMRLHFSVAYEWEPAVWKWAQNFFSTAFWCKFSDRQVELKAAPEEPGSPQGMLDAVADFAATVDGKNISSVTLSSGGKSVTIDRKR
jgi:hypothetical protein